MRKILCLIIPVLLLCSCTTKAEKIKPITKGLKFTAQISFYNEQYECDTIIKQNGDTEISFLSPEDLLGLKINYSVSGITTSYNGLEYNYDSESLPQYSASDILYKIFSAEYHTVLEQDDNYYVEYIEDNLNYKMQIGETGLPIKIKEKSSRFEILIKKPTIIS